MRKLMWFTIGFALSCCAGAYWLDGNWLILLALLCIAFLLPLAFFLPEKAKWLVILLAGCTVASFWMWGYDAYYLSDAESYHGEKMNVVVTATDYSQPEDYGVSVEGRITVDGKTYRCKAYVYTDTPISPSDTIRGEGKLKFTRATGWSTYYSSTGVYLVCNLNEEAEIEPGQGDGIVYRVARLRKSITDILDNIFPADTRGFARALLLGDDSLLSYETNTQLSVSGIRHIIAVSGLHVSILFGLVYTVAGYRKILTPVIGLPLLLLFAALAGFTPSVTRACIMQALMLLGLLFDKEYDGPTALSFAVLVMLVNNPMTVASVGFQLSVLCVVGIFLFSGKIQAFLLDKKRLGKWAKGKLTGKLLRWSVGSISISLSTMVMTTPLCAYYFHTISLVGILTNLLTLWVVTFLLCGTVVACIFSLIYGPLGTALAWLISWPMRYVLLAAKILSGFPLTAVYTQSDYILYWLIFSYILLALFLLAKEKQPVVLLCCVMMGLCVAVAASWIEPTLDDYRLTMLDVGQGQCILVQYEEKTYVVDCGGEYDEGVANEAAQYLLSQGITSVDGLILTHYDRDHAGGAEYFLTRIPAQTLYLPLAAEDGKLQSELALKYNGSICWIEPQSSQVLDGGRITLFAGEKKKSDNESGLCILCSLENCDILITGDRSTTGENALLKQTQLPDLEVLVAGHHGSAYATGKRLLQATQPEVILISVGALNSYGHPAQKMLDRVAEFGCQVLRTDQNGTIIIRG